MVSVAIACSIGYSAFITGLGEDEVDGAVASVASVIDADKRLSTAIYFVTTRGYYGSSSEVGFTYGDAYQVYYCSSQSLFANQETGLISESGRIDFQFQVDSYKDVFMDYPDTIKLNIEFYFKDCSGITFSSSNGNYAYATSSTNLETVTASAAGWGTSYTALTPTVSSAEAYLSATISLPSNPTNQYYRVNGYFIFTMSSTNAASIVTGLANNTITPIFGVSLGS